MQTKTVSAAKLAANRANSQKSTGPKTLEGKAKVSGNAIKHGLRSEHNPRHLAADVAMPFEREEFLAVLDAFQRDLAPVGSVETLLVECLAQIHLRLNRAVRMESTHLEISSRKVFQSVGQNLPDDPAAHDAWLLTLAFLHNPSAMNLIGQYESRLSRDFQRTLIQLRQAQKLRNQTQPVAFGATDVRRDDPAENSCEQTQRPVTVITSTEETASSEVNEVNEGNGVNEDKAASLISAVIHRSEISGKQTQGPGASPANPKQSHDSH